MSQANNDSIILLNPDWIFNSHLSEDWTSLWRLDVKRIVDSALRLSENDEHQKHCALIEHVLNGLELLIKSINLTL